MNHQIRLWLLLVGLLFQLMGAAQSDPSASPVILDVDRHDTLGSLISKLSAKNTLQFAYAPSMADLQPRYFGRITAMDVPDLIRKLFPDEILARSLKKHQILLREKAGIEMPAVGTTNHLTGQVKKDQQDVPIADVIVVDLRSNVSTLTDTNGFFELEGSGDSVLFQMIGYDAKIIYDASTQEDINVRLKEHPIEITPIVVIEKIPTIRLTRQELTVVMETREEALNAIGLGGKDILKTNQFLPGIKADDELSAELKIRGSEGSESLIMLDGIPIYKAEHFYGVFSNINTNYIATSTLYKNDLPAEYGGKTGGMLALTSHPPAGQLSGSVESNLLYTTLQGMLPLGKGWDLTVGGRKSYLNSSQHQVIDLVEANTEFYQVTTKNLTRNQLLRSDPYFNFYDLNAKISFTSKKNHAFDLNFFKSHDDFINSYDLTFLSRQKSREINNTEVFKNEDRWSNTGLSLNGTIAIDEQWNWHSSMYATNYTNEGNVFSQLSFKNSNNERRAVSFSNAQHNELTDLGITTFLQQKEKDHDLKLGIALKRFSSAFNVRTDQRTLIDGSDVGIVGSAFSEYSSSIDRLSWTLGGRLSYYSRAAKVFVDPKLQIKYQAGELISLKGAVNRRHQFVRSLTYESRLTDVYNYFVLSNDLRFPVGSSFNTMIGGTLTDTRWLVDLELYRRNLDGVMEYSLVAPGFATVPEERVPSRNTNYRIFRGKGLVKGLDLLIKYHNRKFQSMLSYTLSESTRQYPGVRLQQPFPAQDDRRHQLQWMNAYQLGSFTFSGTIIYTSGRPYLDLTRIEEARDRQTFSREQFLSRLPAYQRIDLSIQYHFSLWQKKSSLGLSCFNVLDDANVKYLQYIYAIPTDRMSNLGTLNTVVGTETGLLKRTYNASLYIAF